MTPIVKHTAIASQHRTSSLIGYWYKPSKKLMPYGRNPIRQFFGWGAWLRLSSQGVLQTAGLSGSGMSIDH
jgi:hypothetical protein